MTQGRKENINVHVYSYETIFRVYCNMFHSKNNRHYFLPSIIFQLKCVHQVKKPRQWENRKEFPFIIVCTSSKRFVYTVLIPGIFV